jgi:hypothetical protein
MLIFEVEDPSTQKLVALSQFLLGRSEDQASRKQISSQAFIDLANNLGVMVTEANLGDMISRPPLSNILEPYEPNSGVVRFKGNYEKSSPMSVDKAENIVDKNAKAAMRRMK